MRASTLKATIAALIDLKRPCLVEGSPGLGKTQLFGQVCKDKGIGFVHFHAPTMQPEDLALPAANASRTAIDFLVNSRFPLEGRDGPDAGVILIDELSQGDNAIQKTCANLIQEREIHGQKLKPGWVAMATGNLQTDRAGANRILSHLSNRVTRLKLDAHLDDWCNWALDHDIDPTIIAFLRFKPAQLMDFDPARDSYPTPRAWSEGVSPIIGNLPEEAEFEAISGAVGEGAASEFVGFLKISRKLPNPDLVLLQAADHEVYTEPSINYALSGALAHRASADNFDRVMTYAKRMPPEFMVLVVRDAVRRDPGIIDTRAFVDWSVKEGREVVI